MERRDFLKTMASATLVALVPAVIVSHVRVPLKFRFQEYLDNMDVTHIYYIDADYTPPKSEQDMPMVSLELKKSLLSNDQEERYNQLLTLQEKYPWTWKEAEKELAQARENREFEKVEKIHRHILKTRGCYPRFVSVEIVKNKINA